MKSKGYKAVLFSPDGAWATDFNGKTKEEVIQKLANRGSLWLFFPIEAIIADKGAVTTADQRIVAAPEPLSMFVGKSIRTVCKMLSTAYELYPILREMDN